MNKNRVFFKMATCLAIAAIYTLLVYDANAAENQTIQTTENVRIYEVFGMGCPACQGGLSKLVKKVEGVKQVEVNWKEQWVKVTFEKDQTPEDEKIYESIRKANFTPGKRITESSEDEKK